MQEAFKGSTPRTATQSVSRQLQLKQRRKTKLPQGKEKERERERVRTFIFPGYVRDSSSEPSPRRTTGQGSAATQERDRPRVCGRQRAAGGSLRPSRAARCASRRHCSRSRRRLRGGEGPEAATPDGGAAGPGLPPAFPAPPRPSQLSAARRAAPPRPPRPPALGLRGAGRANRPPLPPTTIPRTRG